MRLGTLGIYLDSLPPLAVPAKGDYDMRLRKELLAISTKSLTLPGLPCLSTTNQAKTMVRTSILAAIASGLLPLCVGTPVHSDLPNGLQPHQGSPSSGSGTGGYPAASPPSSPLPTQQTYT